MAMCTYCDGNGVVEICATCNEILDNCDCEGPERIIEEECPECNGDREIDEDEDDEDEGAERMAS